MKKILALTEKIDGSFLAVFVNKKGDKFRFIKKDNLSGEDIKKIHHNIYVSFINDDIINDVVSIPKVKNKKVIPVLIKNKLKEQLNPTIKYTIKFSKIEDKEKESIYSVFALDENFIRNKLKDLPIGKINFVSIFAFSLLPFSYFIYGEEVVLHFYIYENYFIALLSKGKNIKFLRITKLDNLSEVVIYENISLTYLYVSNNIEKPKNIIFSSRHFNEGMIFENFFNTFKTPFCIIYPPRFIENISYEDFNDLTLNIGTLYLSKDYNFLPENIKKERNFLNLLRKLSVVGISILLPLIYIDFLQIQKILDLYFNIQEKERSIKLKLNIVEEKSKNINFDYIYKLSQIEEKYEKQIEKINKVFLLEELIKKYGYDEINIDMEKSEISLTKKLKFNKLTEFYNFKQEIENFKQNNKNLDIQISENLENKEVNLNVKIKK
ncbi:hypothetical protein JCM14244_06690 [Venenivibrio stagnispumantis]|uniref:Uncharacterized protein n=1 Tax=Venenivibrio stagnispumantis TaxID=407998 RepID=A0AA45WIH7_9AQUI|nr:hypothetical protein [Venenivibrio stagnispumantis]MCW4572613.1 hypothetical protein [Venenivibrio stagnispumantis]SMP00569.1 hypothetical protein SAMN06264868_101128 [Venenivibrio stagnispumantis]